MNILFFTSFEVSPQKGGTERTTITVSNQLRETFGHKCFSAYYQTVPEFERAFFDGYLHLNGQNKGQRLRKYVIDNQIDVIINQGGFMFMPMMRSALEGLNCKIVLVHHFAPGFDEKFYNLQWHIGGSFWNHRLRTKIKDIIWKIPTYPYVKYRFKKQVPVEYHYGYELADAMVLLSERYIPEFCEYASITNRDKFKAIPNALSFNEFFPVEKLFKKEKVVLVVSRLDETAKKISWILKIWKSVKKMPVSNGWTLEIVGHGLDRERYEKMVRNQKIPDVIFCGVQSPESYYKRASLYMMTSPREGWGLSLTEAQQFGVVPLAFDSYASLGDIIEDGYNGCLIPFKNMVVFKDRICELMSNVEKRVQMATNAIQSSHRFEQNIIGAMWNDLLLTL